MTLQTRRTWPGASFRAFATLPRPGAESRYWRSPESEPGQARGRTFHGHRKRRVRAIRAGRQQDAASIRPRPARGWRRSERCGAPDWTARVLAAPGARDQAFALRQLPGRLAGASDRLRFLAGFACGRLFISLPTLHLAKNALALHPLFQNSQSLIDIVVANEYLQMLSNRAVAACAGGRNVARVAVNEP